MNKSLRARAFPLFVAMITIASGIAWGCPCDEDEVANPKAGDFEKIQVLANEGSSIAQAKLGVAYLKGVGVQRDQMQALNWLEKSAASGSGEGQYFLSLYYDRAGASKDEVKKSIDLLEKSAGQECASAMYALGMALYSGHGVGRDSARAVDLITRAAKDGSTPAQLWLGVAYVNGDGVKKDEAAGVRWVKMAADKGDSAALLTLANLYIVGKGVAKDEAAAEKILEGVYSKSDKQAPTAAYMLGWLYMESQSLSRDPGAAIQWLRIAAAHNISDAQARLREQIDALPEKKIAHSCKAYSNASLDGAPTMDLASGELIRLISREKRTAKIYMSSSQSILYVSSSCLEK